MKGTCNCGAITFTLEGELPGLYQCHCSLCRKQSGTASNAATIVATEKFKWLSGESSITKWQKDTGFSSHFCMTCGSPVPNPLMNAKYMWIPVGLVDGVISKTVAHLCCSSKAPWDKFDRSEKQFDNMPDDLADFINHLQSSDHT